VRIHHVAFRTASVARLTAFYTEHLGFLEMRSGPTSTWLRAGDAIVMIEARAEEEPGVPEGSMEIVVFTIAKEERAARVARLRAAGVELEGETAFTVYFRDPDGRRVGLSHYPEPTATET